MDFKTNQSYACKVKKIDNYKVDYFCEIKLDENNCGRILIHNSPRKYLNYITNNDRTNISIEYKGEMFTLLSCYVINYFFKGAPEKSHNCFIELFPSCILKGDLLESGKKVFFNGFTAEITEISELLGFFPYLDSYNNMIKSDNCIVKGKKIYKSLDNGFSYFIIPSIKRNSDGLKISISCKIQFSSKEEKRYDEIKSILDSVCLFFEILSGETITINELYLECNDELHESIGMYIFSKTELNKFKSSLDSRSYLRKGLYKVSDFGESINDSINSFILLMNNNKLAFEAYKQILLDEEVKIGTYNKFLKVTQIIEGFQREKISDKKEEEFLLQKNEILKKLKEDDYDFVNKYTTYNGTNFRKCMKMFVGNSLHVISGLSNNKAISLSDKIISKVLNDRDAYTHASKELVPIFTQEELYEINIVFTTFFRVLVLKSIGLSDNVLRDRLYYDRRFKYCYEKLFKCDILKPDSNSIINDFDTLMWD